MVTIFNIVTDEQIDNIRTYRSASQTNIIQNFLRPGLNRSPADLMIPFSGMNRQDVCLDVTVMASIKANKVR